MSRPPTISVGYSHDDAPVVAYVLFWLRTVLTLKRLKTSKFRFRRRVPHSWSALLRRQSTWFSRSPYIVPGGMRSMVSDAVLPASGRPSPSWLIWALVNGAAAVICGPGKLLKVALVRSPHHGSGTTA